jgi:hypothetical protein
MQPPLPCMSSCPKSPHGCMSNRRSHRMIDGGREDALVFFLLPGLQSNCSSLLMNGLCNNHNGDQKGPRAASLFPQNCRPLSMQQSRQGSGPGQRPSWLTSSKMIFCDSGSRPGQKRRCERGHLPLTGQLGASDGVGCRWSREPSY